MTWMMKISRMSRFYCSLEIWALVCLKRHALWITYFIIIGVATIRTSKEMHIAFDWVVWSNSHANSEEHWCWVALASVKRDGVIRPYLDIKSWYTRDIARDMQLGCLMCLQGRLRVGSLLRRMHKSVVAQWLGSSSFCNWMWPWIIL